MSNPQPGFYDDGSGRRRWWNGDDWTDHYESAPAPVAVAEKPKGRTANKMPVSYVREQKGHSITAWILLSCIVVGIPWLIYYSVSPNHYWHA